MRSSEAGRPGAAINFCLGSALTHPYPDPAIRAAATNEQVKHIVELRIFGPALFIVRQTEESAVNTV